MSANAMTRFLTLVINDPERAEDYFSLEVPETPAEELSETPNEVGAAGDADDGSSDPPPATRGSTMVDDFPGLTEDEKRYLKAKDLQDILFYLMNFLEKPAPDDPTGGGG